MKTKSLAVGLLVSLASLTVGCIRPKEYRPVGYLTPLAVPPTPDATEPDSIAVDRKIALPVGTHCLADAKGQPPKRLTPAGDAVSGPNAGSGPCIAFVEYNDKGKHYHDQEDQIESAAALVQKAIDDDPQHQPIIVGFVHGWKHNATPGKGGHEGITEWPPEDSNIQGLEHVLNYLYRCYYADPHINSTCLIGQRSTAGANVQGHVVVGIYFGWYGADISPYWPVAQQISVYSRGGEADKVAQAAALSRDLARLSHIAHPSPKPEHEPMFVLVGHSFGARLLEQAITEPMETRIMQQIKEPSLPTFADLVLYVNSAAPAKDGMDMLQFLAKHKVSYNKTGGDSSPEPLLAAITTPADAATGIAFTLANAPISWFHGGEVSVSVGYDPVTGKPRIVQEDQAKLFRNTLGHLQEFQSHSVNAVPVASEAACKGVAPGTFYYWVPGHCFQVVPATPLTNESFRWNGTPYWVISTDQVIIPDHGTIFTNRFLRFVGRILPTESDKAAVKGE